MADPVVVPVAEPTPGFCERLPEDSAIPGSSPG